MQDQTAPTGQPDRLALITGGAGFIGSNLAQRLLSEPTTCVRIFDDLSRPGVQHNLVWLERLGGRRLEFIHGDIRQPAHVARAVDNVDAIYHLAAQVAVTSSVDAPRADFEVNALGTLNVLEATRLAARRSPRPPFLLFTSTNKVYGGLHLVPVALSGDRYTATDPAFQGVTEDEALDFHSPYGCSKGAADQYVRDYARIYDAPTVVFRMSCIAGPRQFGTEDQGWVAHFLYSTLERRPITIYGDGFQVRDILHVHDLIDAIALARRHADRTTGHIYNIGGGPARAVSVTGMLDAIAVETGLTPRLDYSATRPGDQPLYISNTARFTAATGWQPRFSPQQTLRDIHTFWRENRNLLAAQRQATEIPVSLPADLPAEVLA